MKTQTIHRASLNGAAVCGYRGGSVSTSGAAVTCRTCLKAVQRDGAAAQAAVEAAAKRRRYRVEYVTARECDIITGDAAWCVIERTRVADVVVSQHGEDEAAAKAALTEVQP